MLADELLEIADILRHGEASPLRQHLATTQLTLVAAAVRRLEHALDEIVGEAAVQERRKGIRMVSR